MSYGKTEFPSLGEAEVESGHLEAASKPRRREWGHIPPTDSLITVRTEKQHPPTISACSALHYNNNNNNDRLTAFDPGQPG